LLVELGIVLLDELVLLEQLILFLDEPLVLVVLGLVIAEDELVDEGRDRLAAVGLLGDGVGAERRRHRQRDEQRAGHQRHPGASESLHDRNGTSILATPRGSAGAMAELGAIHARTM